MRHIRDIRNLVEFLPELLLVDQDGLERLLGGLQPVLKIIYEPLLLDLSLGKCIEFGFKHGSTMLIIWIDPSRLTPHMLVVSE